MHFKSHMFIVLYLLLGMGHATPPNNSIYERSKIAQTKLRNHINFLSSDALEGRLTGTIGEQRATQYIANVFQELGLEPAGDHGTFFQEFNFTAGVSLGKNNTLLITDAQGRSKRLLLNQDWRPLSFSDSHSFEQTGLIFAGFGMTTPASAKFPAYDSYKGLNVKNKWVIVLQDVPKKMSAEQRQQISQYSSLRYKAFTAKEHGAIGIIFVGSRLIPLSFDTSLSGSGIIALSIKGHFFDNLKTPRLIEGCKISGRTDITKNIQRGRNVLAKLKMGAQASQMLVVGAHADHLGRGQLSGSRARTNEMGMIHSGADDNASGVAIVLEAAAKLSGLKIQGKLHGARDILFAAWSGEEFGILGSSHFVTDLMKANKAKSLRPAIDTAINLDMVGHLKESLVLQGIGSSSDWPQIINSIKKNAPLSLTTQSDPYLPTDSTSFYVHGVPTLNLFTGAHDEYHTPRDTPETLNYKGIQFISEFLVSLIQKLEDRPHSMNYTEVQKTTDTPEREFKIYLGTIPDYASSDVVGVKLSGVAKNSPAERAGLQPHDVIIELAGKRIHDIYDYTFILNTLRVGKPAKLLVTRGTTKQQLTIVAQYRE